jgi:hypothetical protein
MWQFIKNIFGKKPIVESNNPADSSTSEEIVFDIPFLEKKQPVIREYCVENTTLNDVLIVDIPCLEINATSKLVFEIDVDAKVTLISVDDKKSIKIMITALEDLPSIMNVKYKEIR